MPAPSVQYSDMPSRQAAQTDVCVPATVLFADMIGFTAFCAENDAETVVMTIRALLLLLGAEVSSHGGRVEKLLGDGIMAVFHGPAAGAVACALAMQKAVDAWNGSRRCSGGEPIRIAIGIHSGPVIMAAVGNSLCQETAVLGDTVNVASRVEGKCRCLDAAVLITAQVMRQIGGEGDGSLPRQFSNFGFQKLRGRSDYVHLYGLRRASE